MPRPIAIVPSVLPADFSRLGEACVALQKAGVDRIQWDVMDGHFVPNLTFGPDLIASIRPHVTVPFEAHLMVEHPDELMSRYVEAGCELIIVHAEACTHLHRTLAHIRELGAAAAVALNPATPACDALHVMDMIDLLLVMTVNPGFGGQKYIAAVEPKIAQLRRMIDESGYAIELEVDGGITESTILTAAEAGADTFVAGSSVYGTGDPDAAIARLRAAAASSTSG